MCFEFMTGHFMPHTYFYRNTNSQNLFCLVTRVNTYSFKRFTEYLVTNPETKIYVVDELSLVSLIYYITLCFQVERLQKAQI